jgi:uncharacterized repeat protein (TIGR01451 family)
MKSDLPVCLPSLPLSPARLAAAVVAAGLLIPALCVGQSAPNPRGWTISTANDPVFPTDPSTGRAKVVIELAEPEAVKVYAGTLAAAPGGSSAARTAAITAAQTQVARNEQSQKTLLDSMAKSGLDPMVIYSTQRVYNGIAVLVEPEKVASILDQPGVKAIHPLVSKLLSNSGSVPLIGAPLAWQYSYRGTGVKVGVIDTGIDYIHTDFGGPGTGYGSNVTTIIGDVPSFPGTKVVGGYDFAGDNYDAGGTTGSPIPVPDPDPMDCYGHGTHVAGTLAGYGVNADGSKYAGPYDSTTPFSTMKIGPGSAPDASLYALRVFGCAGSTDLVAPALEWATDPNHDSNFSDHLDIVNMSLGSRFGIDEDPDCVATNNAVLAGVMVVCSAGNDADFYYITGSPGAASRAISVANSVDAVSVTGALPVTAPAAIEGLYPAAEAAFGPDLAVTGPTTSTLAYPTDSGQQSGCAPFNATNAAAIAGKIALIDRVTCSFKSKVLNAQNAGAIGVLIVNNVVGDPFQMGDDAMISTTITIPSMMTTKAAGDLIKAHLSDPGGVTVALTAQFRNQMRNVNTSLVDTLSASSSRGPRNGDSMLKPDITAVGDTVFSAATGTGSQGTSMGGTSMAAPLVAGAMACLRQAYPTLSVEQLKALIMNTATHDLYSGTSMTLPRYGLGRIGAGRVDLALASQAVAQAYNADDPGLVSVSFGAQEILTTTSLLKTVRVDNRVLTATLTFGISYDAVTNIPGVTYDFPDGPTINVGAGSSGTFHVRMTADPTLMKHSRDVTVAATSARGWISEAGGYAVLTPQFGPTLRVPVYAAARPASQMGTAESQVVFADTTGTVTLHQTGLQVNNGPTPPADIRSLVSLYELQETSPDDSSSTGIANCADLKYVGVTTDYKAQAAIGNGIPNSKIFFGIATHAPWSRPAEAEFDIYIDIDKDGTDDFVIYNYSGSGSYDSYYVYCYDLHANTVIAYDYLNAKLPSALDTEYFNSDVMILPVMANALTLTDDSASFNYHVYTFDAHRNGVVDWTGIHTFDAAHPGCDFSITQRGVPMYNDFTGTDRPVNYDRPAYLAAGSQGILLLHHLNQQGSRAQVVAVDATADLSITKVPARNPAPLGENLTYTMQVTNNGPANATGVVVSDLLPPQVTYVQALVSQGTASYDGSGLTANLGSIPSGGNATVTLVVTPVVRGIVSNSANVTGDQPDPNTLNNTAVASTPITDKVTVSQDDQFTTNITNPTPGGTTGWTPLSSVQTGQTTDYDSANTALRVTIATGSGNRINGWVTANSEWLPYVTVGSSKYVRGKFYMFRQGQANMNDLNQVPNMRLRMSARFALSSVLEVFNHLTGDTAGTNAGRELLPSSSPATPSLYRVDIDPVDVPTLGNAGEGISRGFEAYSLESQENGAIEMAESVIGTYPSSALSDGGLNQRAVHQFQTTGSDAGDLKVFDTAADGAFRRKFVLTSPGILGSEVAVGSGGDPTYSEASGGITFDSTAVPSNRVGIVTREFTSVGANTERVRTAALQQYKIRWHVTSNTNANRNPQMRLRARSLKFMWSQKYEIGGSLAAGSSNNTIAQQALPGVGTQNPDKQTPGESGGWYTLLMATPVSPDIQPAQTYINNQPGPGSSSSSIRDIKLGFDLLDTLSGSATSVQENGRFTVDRIELRAFDLVAD